MSLKVGLILYSVRQAMANDTLGTIEEVAKLGYKNLEVCNHNAAEDSGIGFGTPAADIKATFDKYSSKVVSAHIFPLEKANLEEVIAYNKILGNKNIVCPHGRYSTYDNLMKQCEFFNATGKRLADEGMSLVYHNHNHEYRTINDKAVLEHIVENTDPSLVHLELDTFWTMRAGRDPVEMIKKFGKRIKLIHQKDFPFDAAVPINELGFGDLNLKEGEFVGLDGDSMYAAMAAKGKGIVKQENDTADAVNRLSAFTEIGTGIMKIQEIIDAANEYSSAEYIILEQDSTRLSSEIESVTVSMNAFKKFNGISWDD